MFLLFLARAAGKINDFWLKMQFLQGSGTNFRDLKKFFRYVWKIFLYIEKNFTNETPDNLHKRKENNFSLRIYVKK